MAAKLPKELTFEDAMSELEHITRKLEDGKESLELSMDLYEKGMLLKGFCEAKLKEAEGKWMALKKDKNGDIVAEEIPQSEYGEDGQGNMF